MPFQKMQDFTFKHSEQQDAIYTEYTAQQIKALFDSQGAELRIALNLLIDALNSTEGASNIGTQSIQDVDGETIQQMLKSIRDKLKAKADGSSGADYINATAIEGLTGETVQSLLEALKTFVDNTKTTLDNKIETTKSTLESSISTTLGGIKASTISSDPIAVGSGNTVQAQLAWLLTQIAVAATGSIPDGSLSEVKLAQSLIDKINKSLSNTGVLTTLLTNDKSSLVNALNEVLEILNAHSADYTQQLGTAELATTNKTLKGAINEAFQFANDGKTAVANAVAAKGVSASPSDTFGALATKIGQIATGKKWASGTGTTSSSIMYFTSLGGSTAMYYANISGLDFTPSTIICVLANESTWGILNPYTLSTDYTDAKVLAGNTIFRTSNVVIQNGFRMPINANPWAAGKLFSWIAFE